MEGCVTLRPVKLYVQKRWPSAGCTTPRRHSQPVRVQRTSCQVLKVAQLSSLNFCDFSPLYLTNSKANPCAIYRSLKRNCLGTSIIADGASTFEWIPLVDQVLLMTSVFLTYMAGVIPAKKSFLSTQNVILSDFATSENSTLLGSTALEYEKVNSKVPWDIVGEKLMKAMGATEQADKSFSKTFSFEQSNLKQPLSLYAVADGPRIQLLWACFQWLKQQVDDISVRGAAINMNDWSKLMYDMYQNSCQPMFMAWLENELSLKSEKLNNKDLPPVMIEKLIGDNSISQNIRNSGKEDLYAELTQFLIFGSLREGCYYDCSLFIRHGVSILEDLVITLADGVASVYLKLISVDSNMSNEVNYLFDVTMCTLSTRELQKLRNEVALNQWLHLNMRAIVSMYEDRFDLFTLQNQLIEQSKSETGKYSWWKRLIFGNSAAISSPLHVFVINYVAITVKRTKELRALAGWRYYYSLFLELGDITMPLIRTLFAKISDAVSFFLVSLIGRSLGLIYTGIRQSLRWK